MPLYELVWEETRICTGYVRAESESAARQSWIDHDLDSIPHETVQTTAIREINPMPGPHDKLCCCPICEGAL